MVVSTIVPKVAAAECEFPFTIGGAPTIVLRASPTLLGRQTARLSKSFPEVNAPFSEVYCLDECRR